MCWDTCNSCIDSLELWHYTVLRIHIKPQGIEHATTFIAKTCVKQQQQQQQQQVATISPLRITKHQVQERRFMNYKLDFFFYLNAMSEDLGTCHLKSFPPGKAMPNASTAEDIVLAVNMPPANKERHPDTLYWWWYTALMIHCIDDTLHWWYTALMIHCIDDTLHWWWYTALMIHCIDDTLHWWYTALMIHCIDDTYRRIQNLVRNTFPLVPALQCPLDQNHRNQWPEGTQRKDTITSHSFFFLTKIKTFQAISYLSNI